MNQRKQFCIEGHDTALIGRARNRSCRECNRNRVCLRNRTYRIAGILNADGSAFTTVDFDRAYQIQQGKCAGCGQHQSELKNRLCADHDHKTGIFRWLLCQDCNKALGGARDNAMVLRALADLLDA
jgi:hypothetical protein